MSVLDDPVLTLNRNWQVVGFFPVRTAIANVMRDMASVLDVKDYLLLTFEEYAQTVPDGPRWIRTTTGQVPAPDVIVLKKYGERPPKSVAFRRDSLWRRDQWTRQYCGEQLPGANLTVEHVLPRSRGGETSWENCVAACQGCNARKADRTPEEADMELRTTPARPTWKVGLEVPRGVLRPAWMPFLAKESAA